MGSGIDRLREKHAAKKQQSARVKAILDQIDEELSTKKGAKTPESATEKAIIIKFDIVAQLSEMEQQFFGQIWQKMEKIHDDPEPYLLSAVNLAKIFAMGKRLEERIEQDGGPVLEDGNGKLYANPAAKLLQTTQTQILSGLKALGLAITKGGPPKKDMGSAFTSEFAQFG